MSLKIRKHATCVQKLTCGFFSRSFPCCCCWWGWCCFQWMKLKFLPLFLSFLLESKYRKATHFLPCLTHTKASNLFLRDFSTMHSREEEANGCVPMFHSFAITAQSNCNGTPTTWRRNQLFRKQLNLMFYVMRNFFSVLNFLVSHSFFIFYSGLFQLSKLNRNNLSYPLSYNSFLKARKLFRVNKKIDVALLLFIFPR